LGKISGAHINPVVSLSFWLEGKMGGLHAAGYVVAQLLGGILGALPLLAWGAMGASVHFGATLPGNSFGPLEAMAGEVVTTFMLVLLLFIILGHARLRRFTPLLFPFLYAVMVFLEAPVSGTSTNPARSLGPMVVSGDWHSWWVYYAGPVVGALAAVVIRRHRWLKRFEIEVSKLYHFDVDPLGVFKIQQKTMIIDAVTRIHQPRSR
jgi:aquaporin Z